MFLNFIQQFKFLFTGSHDGGIKLWSGFGSNIPIFNKCHQLNSNNHPHVDSALTFLGDSRDSSSLTYLNSQDGEAKLFEIKSLKNDYDIMKSIYLKKVFKSHGRKIVSLKMDDQFVLTGSEDYTTRLFDKLTGHFLFKIVNRNIALTSLEMNEKLIIIGYADGLINFHCKLTGILLGTFDEHTDKINKIKIATLQNKQDVIISASNDCTAKLTFDSLRHMSDDIETPHYLMSDQTLGTHGIDNDNDINVDGFIKQNVRSISCTTHGGRVNDMAVDAHGYIQLATDTGQVHVYNWKKYARGNVIGPDATFKQRSGVKTITIVGAELICGLADGTIDIRLLNGVKVQSFKAHNDQINYVGIK